jgi:hypothetical protein
MKFAVETITPERARAILDDLNTNNYRKVADPTVRRYALDMANGRWRKTGEAIKFDVEGKLADGQHRLLACVKAGEPFTTAVVLGVEPEAAEVMDFGHKRSLSSVLARRGETDTLRLAAALSLGWRWETDQLTVSAAPSPPEALEWLRRNPGIRAALKTVSAMITELRVPSSSLSVFTYHAQRIDPAEEVAFRQALRSGAGLDQGHPVLALRHLLLHSEPPGRKRPGAAVYLLAIFIKAWNSTMQGHSIRYLSWRREGVSREPFPAMVSPRAEATA